MLLDLGLAEFDVLARDMVTALAMFINLKKLGNRKAGQSARICRAT
jgi:hypothetical protein